MHRFRSTSKHTGEHVAEWSIRIVASLSIVVIFLIFIFVFREALSLFVGQPSNESTGVAETELLRPEIYNPEVMSAEEIAQAQVAQEQEQDVYNPDAELDEPTSASLETTPAPEVQEMSLWEKLTGGAWQPVSSIPKFGLAPLLIGTAKTTFVAILIGAPLGILAALYTAFFAPRRLRNIVKPAIELLAGFPSVVIGFFCLSIIATYLQDFLGTTFRLNALVGGIGLSITVIPLVYSIAEEALSAVPRSLREASLAIGSTEWQTAYRVMLPAAAPGVFAAVLLGVGRAFGETMIALMATGNAPLSSWSVLEPARTLAATIGSEMGEVVWGSEHYGILFLIGSILFIFSFGLNAVTELYVKHRFIKKIQGL